MDDATPTADQPPLVIRHDLLDLWLRDACPPYAPRATRRSREMSAPLASDPEHEQDCPTIAEHAE